MEVGGERGFDVTMPEDHADEKLRGKPVHFEVKLVALKRRELPELDDEFAKDVSSFATLAELRGDLERRVAEGREAEQKRLERIAVIDALLAANPFPVPPKLVEAQVRVRISRMLQQLGGAQLPREAIGQPDRALDRGAPAGGRERDQGCFARAGDRQGRVDRGLGRRRR